MKTTGILFSRPMVLALKARTKTETRRVITGPALEMLNAGFTPEYVCLPGNAAWCPYGTAGDLLYCKETCIGRGRNDGRVIYAADYEDPQLTAVGVARGGWKPSILMRQDEARLWYELIEVRAERLQEVTEDGAKAEGVQPAADGSYRSAYAHLWNQINTGFKPVKGRVGKDWKVTHYVTHPWGGEPATVEYKGLPAYITPNPYLWVLRLKEIPCPATS